MDSNGCIAKYKSYHPNFIARSLKINAGMVEIAQIIKNVLELRNSLSLSILLLLFYIAIFIMSFFLQQKRAHLSSSSFVIIVMYNLLFEFFFGSSSLRVSSTNKSLFLSICSRKAISTRFRI